MKLIKPFNTNSFARIVWVNEAARAKWESVIRNVSKFVQILEIESVVEGQRKASWQTISEVESPNCVGEWAKKGLVALPVTRVGNFSGFAHHHPPATDKAGSMCYAVAKDLSTCLELKEAFGKGDHKVQGNLLGFPDCCSTFFEKEWAEGYFDPMWQSACNTSKVKLNDCHATISDYHPFSNSLLRYIGVRIGFHIPCSFNCSATVTIAEERLALGECVDRDLVMLLLALVNLPMTWDVLHGICVVKTPIFYIIAQSVPTIERHTVTVEGKFMPREVEKHA